MSGDIQRQETNYYFKGNGIEFLASAEINPYGLKKKLTGPFNGQADNIQEVYMGKAALIVADMLNDFLDPQGALYVGPQAREIIPFVAEKIAEFHAQGGVVIYACDAHAPDDREFKLFPPHAVKGSWGAGIIPELTPAPGDYQVEKTRYSAFSHTNLDELQRERGNGSSCGGSADFDLCPGNS